MASRVTAMDLTPSDDDDNDQPATLARALGRRTAATEIIEISDDEDEAQDENEDDLVGPLLAALGHPQPIIEAESEPPIQIPSSRAARAPTPAPSRLNDAVRAAEVVLHLFSDGSFINDRFGGAGVSWRDNTWHGRAVPLGRVKSSFDAELHAILEGIKAAHAIVDRRPDVTKVVVQTDCEACLISLARARAAGGGHYGLLDETLDQEALLKSRGLEVKLWWVKGHSDSVGNDVADNLARYGAVRARISPAHWGVYIEDPPSAALDRANALRHGDRRSRKAAIAPQTRRARKEAKRRARG